MTATILTGCGSKDTESEIESEITTEVETATIEETTTESETTTTEEETSTIEETSTESETTTEVETSTTEDETTTDVIVKNGITFAGDADESDINQVMKAIEAGLDARDCDINDDGLIDKEEAADAAFLFDDEVIADANDFAESIKKSLEDELMQEIESSSSTSESTTGTGKVESWADNTANTPQIDFSTPTDHTNLEKGVTVY